MFVRFFCYLFVAVCSAVAAMFVRMLCMYCVHAAHGRHACGANLQKGLGQ